MFKKDNWLMWLFLYIFTGGLCSIIIAGMMDLYKEDAWYSNWKIWLTGALLFFIPIPIMIIIFMIQSNCLIANKLNIHGNTIYMSPYSWIV